MYDEAVDHEHPKLLEQLIVYNKTGDYSGLPLKEGMRPAVWEFRPLTRAQEARVRKGAEDDEERRVKKAREAMAVSLVRVSNVKTSEGVEVVVEHTKVGDELRVKPEILDLLFDPDVGSELLDRILRANRLNPTSG